jgi:phage terminase small subunit
MLTANQENFVQNIIQGMNQADAYRSAYPNSKASDKTVHEAASRLMSNSKVLARLTELRQELATPAIMSAKRRLEWLTEVINGEEDINAKLKAVDIMNKMQGKYVQKIEADVKNEVTINIELSDDE